jgi:hypothetical protein
MKRYALVLGCSLAAILIHGNLQSADPPQEVKPTELSALMHMKLEKSKAILEGLTLEDYDKVIKNAHQLKSLSLESGWSVIQTPEYTTQSNDFRRACDLIADAAKEKDISRATLGYVSLTVRCVECHSYMRKHRMELSQVDRSDAAGLTK